MGVEEFTYPKADKETLWNIQATKLIQTYDTQTPTAYYVMVRGLYPQH